MKHLLTLLFALFITNAAFCQSSTDESSTPKVFGLDKPTCGYVMSSGQEAQLDAFHKWYYVEGNNATAEFATKYVAVTMHLVQDSDGSNRIKIAQTLDLFHYMNQHYADNNAEIVYCIKDINLDIKNTNWNAMGSGFSSAMPAVWKDNTSMNAFFLNGTNDLCGVYIGSAPFTGNPGSPDACFLGKICLGANPTNITWAHEFGHYLSLPHTFSGWENYNYGDGANPDYECLDQAPNFLPNGDQVEKVDGSNCGTAGDRICDTAPDYLSYRWNCNSSQESSCVQKDPNGVNFSSDGTNIMSYSNDACSGNFTTDQIAEMHFNLQTYRQSYYSGAPTWNDITSPAILETPVNDGIVNTPTSVSFDWEDTPEAEFYLLEISLVPSFAFLTEEVLVTESEYTSTILSDNTTYRWRVRPFNKGSVDPALKSEVWKFSTDSEYTNTNEIEGVSEWSIVPNPSTQGTDVELNIATDHSFEAAVKVYSIEGALLTSQTVQFNTGKNQHRMNGGDLAKGLYLVSIESEEGVMIKKLMVQ